MTWMGSKSNSEILNNWWANGIPLGTPGGASGGVTHIGSATVFIGAGEAHIGYVGGNTVIVSASPLLTTGSPYAAGHLAGTGGALTFPNAGRIAGGAGVIQSATLVDKAKRDIEFDLVIFNSPTASTTFTGMAAFDVDDADLYRIAGVITFPSADYVDFSDNSVCVDTNTGIVYQLPAGTSTLHGALVARAAATFDSTTDLSLHLGLLRD